jgi:putative transposase
MLLYEYKRRLSRVQAATSDEAIRTTQFIRNKCVRLLRQAEGYYAQFVLQVERHIQQAPAGASRRHRLANPRFIRLAEARRQRSQRRLSRQSLLHQQGKQPRTHHAARQRARHNKYPKDPAAPVGQRGEGEAAAGQDVPASPTTA